MQQGGYPAGAEWDSRAPYNESINYPQEIEVDVCLTMSLRTKIKVDDYETFEDDSEDGKRLIYDFKDCNLEKQALEQIKLPTDTPQFSNWTVDDFFVQESL